MRYAARYYCTLLDRRIQIYKMKYLSARCTNRPIYQKLVEKGGIEKNEKGHITKVSVWDDTRSDWLLHGAERKSLKFDIKILPKNLTKLDLNDTGITGDIQVLQALQHLTEFDLMLHGCHGGHSSPPSASILDRILPHEHGCHWGHSSPARASTLDLFQPPHHGCHGGHSSPARTSKLDRILPLQHGCHGGQESVSKPPRVPRT